jgi:hypothetical protein
MTLAFAFATPHSFDGWEEPEARVHRLKAARARLLEMMQQSPMGRGRRGPRRLLGPGAKSRSEPCQPTEGRGLHVALDTRHLARDEEPGARADLETLQALRGVHVGVAMHRPVAGEDGLPEAREAAEDALLLAESHLGLEAHEVVEQPPLVFLA